MDPHEVAVEIVLEHAPVAAVPGKVDDISALGTLGLFDIADLAFAKHLGAPVPGIGEVGDEGRRLRPVVYAGSVLARQCGRRHLHAAAVWAVPEACSLWHSV